MCIRDRSIGIIGTSTPGLWDEDTDLIQDPSNPDLWTLSITLTDGLSKFRQDDDWLVNWGATDFPLGTGVQGGDDIPTPGGPYDITFNSATGEYSFTYTGTTFGSIGILGDATPTAWDSDTDMTPRAEAPWVYDIEMELGPGVVKFRADDDWVDNWGSLDFPSGIGLPGGDNIPVEPNTYLITFNSNTGFYNFETLIPDFEFISIIGDGAPSADWAVDDFLEKVSPDLWRLQATFNDGGAKIRADTAWDVNWGSTDFPMGTGAINGDNIPVVAGDYLLTFNPLTGAVSYTHLTLPTNREV